MTSFYFPKADEHGIDPDPREFSKFAELQSKSIQEALAVHHYSKEAFAEWVIKGNIDGAQNVRKIPAILATPRAKEEFLKYNISAAVRFLNVKPKETKDLSNASMHEIVVELISRIRSISYPEFKALRDDPRRGEEKTDIRVLLDELESFMKDIEGEQ
jgi:hypothetical protein